MARSLLRRSTHDKYPKYPIASTHEFSEPRKPLQQSIYDYKPFATRLPFLASILLIVLACIAAIEIAFHYGSNTLNETSSANVRVRQEDDSVFHNLDSCAVTVIVSIVRFHYVSARSIVSTNLRTWSSSYTPIATNCLLKRQTITPVTLTTSSDSYVYDQTSADSTSTGDSITTATTPAAYAADVTPCYATATVGVVIFYESSTIPVSTIYSTAVSGDTVDSGCTTVTETQMKTSYLADTTYYATTTTGYAVDQKPSCYATAMVEVVVFYRSSSIPVSTSYSTTIEGDTTGLGCSTVTETQTKTSYLVDTTYYATTTTGYAVDATPGTSGAPVTQISDASAYATDATPGTSAAAPVEYATDTTPSSITTILASATSQGYAADDTPSSTTETVGSSSASPVAASQDDYASDATPTGSPGHSEITTTMTFAQNPDSYVIGKQPSTSDVTGTPTFTESAFYAIGSTTASSLSTVTIIVDIIYSTISLSSTSSIPSISYVTVTQTTASATTSSEADQTSLPSLQESQLVLGPWKHFEYFCANYLGVLVAVMLKGLWSIVFASAKMMEPFYQLAKDDGATVSESLLANYLSTWLSWRSFRAICGGQWVMLATTLIYAVMSALSPIATETMGVMPTQWCTINGAQRRCDLRWILQKPWARALEGILSLIALLILLLMVISFRRKSGIQSNPSTLAFMASLIHHCETLDEIRALDPYASDHRITEALSGSAYKIEQYRTLDRRYHYGLVKVDPVSPGAIRQRYNAVSNPHNLTMMGSAQSHFTSRALRDTVFLLCICGLFGTTLGYYLASGPSPFNDFFNSGKWYPRFVLTSVAVLINLQWKTIEREVRVITPYRRLSRRHAKPEHTILVTLNGTPATSIIPSIFRGDVFHAFIALVTILSDLLIIAIAGVPFSKNQVWAAFLGSSYASMIILGIMVLALLSLFMWRIQNEKMRLPREPDTLLGVWMMLCNHGNVICQEYKGAHERELFKEVSERSKALGRVYYAGWLDFDVQVKEGPEGRNVNVKDEVTRRFVVDADGDGRVAGYNHPVNYR